MCIFLKIKLAFIILHRQYNSELDIQFKMSTIKLSE